MALGVIDIDGLVFTGTYSLANHFFFKNGYALAGSKQPRHFKGSPSKGPP
jgi:hypothetical protein